MSLRALRPDRLAFFAAVTLGLALASCAQPRHLDPNPWTRVDAGLRSQGDPAGLSPAAPAALVSRAQWLLSKLGYDAGLVDGIEGPRTVAAVQDYQNANRLNIDGRVSSRLVANLEGSREAKMIADVQERLQALGFDPGGIDGALGPRTRTAIEAYQQSAGLTADGDLSPSLLRLLAVEPVFAQGGTGLQPTEIPASAAMPSVADGSEDSVVAALASAEPSKLGALSEAGQGDVVATLSDADRDAAGPGRAEAEESEGAAVALETNNGELAAAVSEPDTNEFAGPLPQVGPNSAGDDSERLPQFALRRLPDENTPLGPEPPEPDLSKPLAPGDRVRLIVFGKNKEERELEVSADGRLYLSDGVAVRAAGLSLPELEEEIMIKLVETYFLGLSVTVSRPEPPSEPPLELGDGETPGDQPVP